MSLRVRLFARMRDLAGADELLVEVPPGCTAEQLRRHVGARCPALVPLLGRCALACNNDFADPEHVLQPGDEVALLPPVSGGAAQA